MPRQVKVNTLRNSWLRWHCCSSGGGWRQGETRKASRVRQPMTTLDKQHLEKNPQECDNLGQKTLGKAKKSRRVQPPMTTLDKHHLEKLENLKKSRGVWQPMTTLDRHLLEKLENPKIPKSTTSLDKHHLLGDQDKAEAAFPTRALSGIPQDLVWELSLFAVRGALCLSLQSADHKIRSQCCRV